MKHLRICFVGDSFVNGTGDPACLGWAGRLCVAAQQQGHEITYYNLGIRRQTSRDIADRWQAEVAARLPTEFEGRIVFSFGVNDTTIEDGKERVTLAESLEHTRRILLAARQCFPTLMVGPPPVLEDEHNQRIARLSEQLTLVCEVLEVPYLEVFAPLQQVNTWKKEIASNDGSHPRADGYATLSQLIQAWSAWRSWLT